MSAPEELGAVAQRVLKRIEAHRKAFDPAFSMRVDTRDYLERRMDAEHAAFLEDQCVGREPIVRIKTE